MNSTNIVRSVRVLLNFQTNSNREIFSGAEITMGKYFMTWTIDPQNIPISREDRAAAWKPMIDMVKQGIENGVIKEWGAFVGENNGYSIAEGTEAEISAFNQRGPTVD